MLIKFVVGYVLVERIWNAIRLILYLEVQKPLLHKIGNVSLSYFGKLDSFSFPDLLMMYHLSVFEFKFDSV